MRIPTIDRNESPEVAIVDDDTSLRLLIRSILEETGFQVTEYSDGQSAYEGLINHKPSLLLLDVRMPGLSGYDLCRLIREDLGDVTTPVIIMTGDDSLSAIEQAFDSGATDFFPKPLNFALLTQRIRYALRNSQAWQMQTAYQNQLLQSEKMASLGQLAAGVAHEINNPIGYVQSNVQVLSKYTRELLAYIEALESGKAHPAIAQDYRYGVEAPETPKTILAIREDLPEMLTDIEEGVGRIGAIVKSLKTFAHPEEDKLTRTDLTELVRSVQKMIVGDLKYKADVRVDCPDSPVWVLANPSTLYQVLMNLLINAIQAIKHDHGDVSLTLSRHGKNAQISITDNGSGIADSHLSRIFDPFFTTKEVGEGTGLGLSVSKAIVDKHQGSLTVTSAENKGSTFTVTLTLLPAQSPKPFP